MSLVPNRVYSGDCLQQLRKVPAGSVDLVFADPPFNIGYEYDQYDDRRSREDYLDWSRRWMVLVHRCLKDDGTFWLAIGDEYAAELKVAAQNDIGFSCRSWVIWYYTFGVNCVRGFSRSHTHLLHFVKDPQCFTFNGDNPTVRVPSARQLVYADQRANPRGRLPDNTWIFRPQDAPGSFRPEHDTWYFARVAGTFHERQGFHGCQMPEQLLGRIVRISSDPCQLVLDPFAGSGTTLAVAKKLGRRWLGIELSRQYVRQIRRRLESARPGDPLKGPADPLASAPPTSRGRRRGNQTNGYLSQADSGQAGNGRADSRQAAGDQPSFGRLQRGILAACRDACRGYSAEEIVCVPELNAQFVAGCRQAGLPGSAAEWNRQLWQLRRADGLPRRHQRTWFTLDQFDAFSFACEIAWQLLELDTGRLLNELVWDPDLARRIEATAERWAPGFSAAAYRLGCMRLERGLARAQRAARPFLERKGRYAWPVARPIARPGILDAEHQGVYVLESRTQTLYVGETKNLGRRLQLVRSVEPWQELDVTRFRFLPAHGASRRGLQAALIARLAPPLNRPAETAKRSKAGAKT